MVVIGFIKYMEWFWVSLFNSKELNIFNNRKIYVTEFKVFICSCFEIGVC